MRSHAIHLAKAVLRPIRDGVNRSLHPWFRQRAQRELEGVNSVRVVVFVCLGNVCRSPYAAARFRGLVGEQGLAEIEVRSVGFIGPGRNSPDEAQSVALERGIDLSDHRSRVVEIRDAAEADLLIVMTPEQKRRLSRTFAPRGKVLVLGDLDPESASRRGIPDPWGKPLDVFRSSFQRIDRCLQELVMTVVDDSSVPLQETREQ